MWPRAADRFGPRTRWSAASRSAVVSSCLATGSPRTTTWFASTAMRVSTRWPATVSVHYEVQLNVRNLLDEDYYETAHANNNIMPAAGRNGLVTVRYRF